MKKRILPLLSTLFTLFVSTSVSAQLFPDYNKKKTWNEILQYFTPPTEYQNNYGDYRLPLEFYNGDTVKTKADWQRRRTEIKSRWMEIYVC